MFEVWLIDILFDWLTLMATTDWLTESFVEFDSGIIKPLLLFVTLDELVVLVAELEFASQGYSAVVVLICPSMNLFSILNNLTSPVGEL